MPTIILRTEIDAPIETVFNLSRCIDLHIHSTSHTNERAIAGKTSGLIELGESVTWEATHFFIRQQLSVEIVQFNHPVHFRDSMTAGIFASFDHDHHFEPQGNSTVMTDRFDFTSPWGLLGRIANRLFVTRHLRKLLVTKNAILKTVAESDEATQYLSRHTDKA